MPFFCDLYDFNTTTKETQIPPELIPYTQTLYYDSTDPGSSDSFGKQNYVELFSAPWDGKTSERMAHMTLEWSGQRPGMKGSEETDYNRDTKSKIEINNQRLGQVREVINELQKGKGISKDTAEKLQALMESNAILKVAGMVAPELTQKIYTLWSQPQRLAEDIDKYIKEMLGLAKKTEEKLEKDARASNNSANNDSKSGPQQGIRGYTKNSVVTTENLKLTLNGVIVEYGDKYSHGDGLSITKSIVCKNSTAQQAVNCIRKLASYLGVVAPNFAYTQGNNGEWSRNAIQFSAPNNFAVEGVKKGEYSTNGILQYKVENTDTDTIKLDLFNYRGELQLRQGYYIYRNLVPTNVIITTSSDMLFLNENPFDQLSESTTNKIDNSEKSKDKLTYVNTMATLDKDPGAKFIAIWKTNKNLCNAITLYNGRKGYLFPQWINVTVALTQAEPYDGFTATQQLFCFSDKSLKIATGTAKSK